MNQNYNSRHAEYFPRTMKLEELEGTPVRIHSLEMVEGQFGDMAAVKCQIEASGEWIVTFIGNARICAYLNALAGDGALPSVHFFDKKETKNGHMWEISPPMGESEE